MYLIQTEKLDYFKDTCVPISKSCMTLKVHLNLTLIQDNLTLIQDNKRFANLVLTTSTYAQNVSMAVKHNAKVSDL